jgi:glutathione S-transferase
MLDFYFSPGSCALASHILLEEIGAKYESHRIDFSQNEQQGEAYLKLNPKGRVPALATQHGTLTETPAILVYLAETHDRGDLIFKADPYNFARVQSFNNYLCATVHVAHAHKGRGHRWASEPGAIKAMQAHVPTSMSLCFEYLENEGVTGPFVMGETYSVADPYLYTICRWAPADGVDISKLPKIKAHMEMMAKRDSTLRALRAEGLQP